MNWCLSDESDLAQQWNSEPKPLQMIQKAALPETRNQEQFLNLILSPIMPRFLKPSPYLQCPLISELLPIFKTSNLTVLEVDTFLSLMASLAHLLM